MSLKKISIFYKIILILLFLVIDYIVTVNFFIIPEIDSSIREFEQDKSKAVLKSITTLTKEMHKDLLSYKKMAYENYKNRLKDVVDTATSSLQIEQDLYSKKDARERAIERLSKIRYDKDGFFFAINYNGIVLYSPYIKKGVNIINLKDAQGEPLTAKLINAAEKNPNGAFVEYWWYKTPKKINSALKLTFVKGIPKWDMIVGTGVFIDDIEKEIHKRKRELTKELKEIIYKTKIAKNGYLFLFNSKGDMLIHPDKELEKKNLSKLKNPDTETFLIDDFKKATKTASKEIHYKWHKVNDKSHFFDKTAYVEYIPEFDWYIVATAYNDDIYRLSKTLTDRLYMATILGIILFVIIFLFLLKRILKPLDILSNTVSKIASGDYKARNNIQSSDEIGVLAKNINKMADTIEDHIINLDNKIKSQTKSLNEQMTKAKEANSAKSQFLANMSHEIRTPLNAILGFVDLLKEEDIGRKSLNYILIIEESSNTLLQTINDILDFSKIESGQMAIEKIAFNPEKELKNSIEFFKAKAHEKDIELKYEQSDNLPKFIKSDPLRIKQILNNLLSNAIKFTPDKKSITVYADYKEENLIIKVKDEGIGIAKEKLKDIFNAFSQEDSSTTRKYGGTGLGLSISSKLAKLLGGELRVESKKGEGSIFTLIISAEAVEDKKEKEKNISDNIDFKDKKILLVEDNKSNQIFMKIVLQKLGLKFDIANDGVEAVELFKKNSYDAILMDENMPNMSGIEATKKILEIEKEKNLKHTPIIALTANAIKGDRERFLEAGMDEYLTKPIDKEKLIEVLSIFLRS